MKKFLAVMISVLMLVSLAACGTSEGGAQTTGAGENTAGNTVYTIGICQLVQHEALDAATEGFIQAVKDELGEENVVIKLENASGDSNTCSTIVNTFVSDEVDLIMANATPALQAAASATSDIPILGTSVTEYGVAMGMENFDGTVGGNVSGTSDLAPLDEQAAMIKEWFPDAKNVGLLYCSAEANSKYQVDVIEGYLTEMGYTCTRYSFTDSNDMASVVEKAAAESDVIYAPTDNTVANGSDIVDGICRPAEVPVIAGEAGICRGCGVATLSIDYYDLGYATGVMAAKVLRGEADISTMPIEYTPAEKITKMYNAEICEELGLIPLEGYTPLS